MPMPKVYAKYGLYTKKSISKTRNFIWLFVYKLIKNYEYTKKSLSSTLPITYNIITSSSSSSSMQTGKMHKQSSMISNSGISASFNVDDTCKLTYLKCFNRNLNEIKDMACQHELVAENLQKRVLDKLNAELKNFKDERKKVRFISCQIDGLRYTD
jgi:hypothetical protein